MSFFIALPIHGDNKDVIRRAQEIQMASTHSWGVCLDLAIKEFEEKRKRGKY